MSKRNIQAIIFDSDGTLVDSEEPSMDVLHAMAVAEGVEFTRDEAHRQFRGVRMSEISGWVRDQLRDCAEDFEVEFTRKYRAASEKYFREHLKPMPGATELLRWLKIPFGVATNGPREKVLLTLEVTGLLQYVGNRIFSAYDQGHFKPDPQIFLGAARSFGVAPENCAVVEDSIPGLLAGIDAGMQVFSLHRLEGLPQPIADKVFFLDSLLDLKRYMESRC